MWALMVEPFDYRPWELARLTDFQVLGMFSRHAENVREMKRQSQASQGGSIAPPAPKPKPGENVRCGATYEYLVKSGMTPEQAEAVIRRS